MKMFPHDVKQLGKKYLFRKHFISVLRNLILLTGEEFPSVVYIYGHSGTGKTSITKDISQSNRSDSLQIVYINCVEYYTISTLLERILGELIDGYDGVCDSLEEFVQIIRTESIRRKVSYVFVMDNADRLRGMNDNVMPFLLRLRELSHLNICVLLIGQVPFEKYYCKSGLTDVITLHCSQYSKNEVLQILSNQFNAARSILRCTIKKVESEKKQLEEKLDIVENINIDFFANYLNVFLSVFYKVCRDVPELKNIACTYFTTYMDPILSDGVDMDNLSHLWRNSTVQIRSALAHIYMRFNNSNNITLAIMHRKEDVAKYLDLPLYGKYLLIAAYLASHKSAKNDKRLFVKSTSKSSKRAKLNAKTKSTENVSTTLGPKSFSIDRLLAIFYAIQSEKIGLTCNLLSQLSTLVHLKLIDIVSGESNMDESTKLQCKINLECIAFIGKFVGFNVCEYL